MTNALERVIPVLMVRDVVASLRFYRDELGFAQRFVDATPPRYAGVARDRVELHLQWHDWAGWSAEADRPTYRFPIADPDALHATLAGRGLDLTAMLDTAWGTREFHLRDPDRNGLQFYRPR